jgi:hypothetical protein
MMGHQCHVCQDTTTNKDGICDLCRADQVEFIAKELEAMLQYDERRYKTVRTEGNRVIVEVY